MSGDRTVLVDASVFITLAAIGEADLLASVEGTVTIPAVVAEEIIDDPAASALQAAIEDGRISVVTEPEALDLAADHLGRSPEPTGDVVLLGHALSLEEVVLIADDKPLRTACKALSVPVSGSIGVIVRAVERGEIEPDDARDRMEALDEVGARLSARLLRRAETLIDDAATE